jgi:predicted nucleotidyltransferase
MAATLQRVMQRLKATESELRCRGVAHLSVFGSLVRGEARDDSDIDIAVEIESGRSFSLIRMEDTRLLLEDVLGHPVDLGEVESFRPAVRAAFEQDRIRVF